MSPDSVSAAPVSQVETTWHWLQAQLAGRPVPPVLTIVGLGDGSLLDALDAHAPGTRVLAVEPDPERATLTHSSVATWRRSGRLVYLVAPQFAGADQGWRIFPNRVEEPPLLVLPGSAASPGLRASLIVLRKIVFGAKANAEARRRFAPRYLLNSIRNLPAILAGRDVRDLGGYAKGAPAVVVGAGPSLDQSLAELKRLQERAVIIATDTALRPLLLAGIVPQFVVALDPSDLNGRHLLDLPPCHDTWLVAESALDPRATAAFHGRTFWFRVAPHQPWPWLKQFGMDVGHLDVWGSVLTAGFQLACLAGCDPIVMIGADLSFPDGRPYARGTTYEFDWAWAAALGTPVEETWRTLLTSRNDLRVERDVTGSGVSTTPVMLAFRDWIVAQAKKGGRRVVNATGRGLLEGEGVEQRTLSDALSEAPVRPRLLDAHEAAATAAPALAAELRALTLALTAGDLACDPLPAWQEFSGEGFDAAHLASAVADTCGRFDAAAGPDIETPSTGAAPEAADSRLAGLPEASSRLRCGLGGRPPMSGGVTTAAERRVLLLEALQRLAGIVHETTRRQDFPMLRDPALIGTVPAGAVARWPEPLRWAVLRFEGLLGDAWDAAVPPPAEYDFADGRIVFPDPPAGVTARLPAEARLNAAHGCLLLALEWLRCAASLSSEPALLDVNARLWALAGVLRRAAGAPLPPGAPVELVIDVRADGRGACVALPLAVSDASLARVMSGAMRADGEQSWELGSATVADLSVRVALQRVGCSPGVQAAHSVSLLPRRVSFGPEGRIKVADQTPGGVLCVIDFARETVLMRGDGTVEPYQTWPRPITGALSLGSRGEVAWSNIRQRQKGVAPYLMYRPDAGASVVTIELGFRPGRGLWWRDRLYVTCLPDAEGPGGLACWAPGEAPRVLARNPPLQALVHEADALILEPYVLGAGETVTRRHPARGWRWMPDGKAMPRTLGPLGASSGVAVNGNWTATAYPQADVVALEHRAGRRLQLRCYNPARLGWADESLVVFGGDGETLLFERLLPAIEA